MPFTKKAAVETPAEPEPEPTEEEPKPEDSALAGALARIAQLESLLERVLATPAPAAIVATPTAPAVPPAGLHADIGQWHDLPATPAKADVPGYWVRNTRTGVAFKVIDQDTLKRCLRGTQEGPEFVLIDDPTVTPGVPIFGQPMKPLAQLGLGPTASTQRVN